MFRCVKLLTLVSLTLYLPCPSSPSKKVAGLPLQGYHSFVLEVFVQNTSLATGALISPKWALVPFDALVRAVYTDVRLEGKLMNNTLHSSTVTSATAMPPRFHTMKLEKAFPRETPTVHIATRFDVFFYVRCTILTAYNNSRTIRRIDTFGSVHDCSIPNDVPLDTIYCVTTLTCFRTLGALMICQNRLVAMSNMVEECIPDKVYTFLNIAVRDYDILMPIQKDSSAYRQEKLVEYSIKKENSSPDLRQDRFFVSIVYIISCICVKFHDY
ncbi:hypothetical protein Trydic_g8614 [Trypoxylus dichotomus]